MKHAMTETRRIIPVNTLSLRFDHGEYPLLSALRLVAGHASGLEDKQREDE